MPAGSFVNFASAQPPEPPRPLVRIALAHVAGMAAGLALAGPAWVWFCLIALPLTAALVFLWRSRRIRSEITPEGGLLVVAVFALGGWFGSGLEQADRAAAAALPDWADQQLVRAEGILAEEPRGTGNGHEFVLRDATLASMRVGGGVARVPGKIAFVLYDSIPEAMPIPGQPVRIVGRFRRADAPPTTPGTFQPARYWRSRGIFGRISVATPPALEVGAAPEGLHPWLLKKLRGARAVMHRNLGEYLSGDTLALAYALLIGETGNLDDTVRENFTRTGLAHVLSVSGLHTGFILVLLLGLGRLMWLPPRAGAWLAMAGLVLYAALTGFQPPVVRAATMGIFILFSHAIGRFVTPLASVATAAWVTLLVDPRNLLRLDWQLSYACAVSIILLAPPIYDFFMSFINPPPKPGTRRDPQPLWKRWASRWILAPLAVIFAVQFGLAPLQLYYFQNLNPGSFLSNLIVVPLSALAMTGALFGSLLGGIPWIGGIAGWMAGLFNGSMIDVISWLSAIPFMSVAVTPWPLWLAAIYLMVLLGGAHLLTGRERFLALDARQRGALALCFLACFAIILATPLFRGRSGLFDFYMLDVGQGDSLVARFPDGRVMVIDGGANVPADQGRLTIAPFLHTLGVQKIDCLVATHADADHIGGLPSLIEQVPVGSILVGTDLSNSLIYHDLLRAIEKRNIPVIAAVAGRELKGFGGISIRLLGPLAGRDDNDASIGLLIDTGDVEILATGDMEAAAERQLLKEFALPDIEVLKVGHHGSRSSTIAELLERTRPEIALVSAGRRNRYGHPAPEVLERLDQHGALTLRTDLDGTIWLRTDGRWVSVYRFRARR